MPFTHNLIYFSLPRFGRIATINTINNDRSFDTVRSAIDQVKPDLIFVQKIVGNVEKGLNLMQDKYHFRYTKNNYDAGILLKQTMYYQIKHLPDTCRDCSVYLHNVSEHKLVAISWCTPTGQKGKDELDALSELAEKCQQKYKADVIIGGSFCDTAQAAIDRLPEDFQVKSRREDNPHDYFIYLPVREEEVNQIDMENLRQNMDELLENQDDDSPNTEALVKRVENVTI